MTSSCCGGTSSTKPRISTFNGKVKAISPGEKSAGSCCGNGGKSASKQSCSCKDAKKERWVLDFVDTPAGKIPRVSTRLEFRDILGSWKCRWSIGRMNYKVDPGLYCVGSPDAESPVLVTANYKMTFDRLRMELDSVSAWIMVLDTDGVNVWCAAGKGTFGTKELVHRIRAVQLDKIVSHRNVIVPQLGATGVSAQEVTKRAGFKVVFSPVRACDLIAFLSAGMVATEDMRTVKFPFFDRLVLTPMEVVSALKPMIMVLGILFTLNVIGLGRYGRVDFVALLGAIIAGCVVTPVLLPWVPGRAFSVKGVLIGLIWAIIVNVWQGFPQMPDYGWLKAIAYFLVIPAISSFYAMNFTGSSTYTSLSGVDKEMKIALPSMLLSTGIGVVLFLVNDFIKVFG